MGSIIVKLSQSSECDYGLIDSQAPQADNRRPRQRCELGEPVIDRSSLCAQDTTPFIVCLRVLKDGALYCYYVLSILRYLDFLWVVLISTGIFLRGSKLRGES